MIQLQKIVSLALLMMAALPVQAQSAAQPTEAPAVNLRLNYENRSIGHDGITRDSRYTDLMYRRAGLVWIERELPESVRESAAHGHEDNASPHAGHAHSEAQGAPLLVRRDAAIGKVSVQAVLHNLHRVIDVELAHYGNVGYGGSWAAAYWLIEPAALSRMEKQGPEQQGIQHYLLQKGERTVKVAWDVAGQYARSIEQRDNHGTSVQRMTATPFAEPQSLPWQQLADYQRGDYSDLLD
ncbi:MULTISPECIES: hypothetical protein [unclassified Serratia (in: enterobacteria)]|uniref:hypothetical protein n=1 Tax=unclassified Serratia (in: enterobacteria) TaxID=2647522 RepID=UPI0009079BB7|nr:MULTISPECIES: hypothetical protein [unclassified Serratia (in: enterobacteria)]